MFKLNILLAESNVPLKAIMSRVGHKDAKTTNQIYTHVTKIMEQAVLDALDTVALNLKQNVLPPFCPLDKKRAHHIG